ncbi:zinc finger protein 566-like [Patiria miniata]|uniref:C2H2-type domain-containing protein n=1 Tax=Patiria miniata TaxID=46514 RepID=A0A914B723_PATMI|nr:zinc finger protein 566-like [Patiria miniata]
MLGSVDSPWPRATQPAVTAEPALGPVRQSRTDNQVGTGNPAAGVGSPTAAVGHHTTQGTSSPRNRRGRAVRRRGCLRQVSGGETKDSQPVQGKATYTCRVCGQQYVSSFTRRRHEKAAHEERSYQCRECPKSYGRSDYLTRHMRAQHRGPTSCG